jgi:hypothetical protein
VKKLYFNNLLAITLLILFGISLYFFVNKATDYYIEYFFYDFRHGCPTCQKQIPDPKQPPDPTILYITACAMIFTGIGTFSTLIFSLIKERRETRETKLRIEKLELEIAELKSKEEEKKPKITMK